MAGKRFWILFLFCLAGPLPILAQSDAVPLDSSSYYIVRKVFMVGNKITKERIISRESTLAEGDTVRVHELVAQLERSRQNIMNTRLFNSVSVEKLKLVTDFPADTVFLDLMITVSERWYTWPNPIFELVDPNFNTWWLTRDFNRTNYGLQLYRQNFRGRNETLAVVAQFGYTKQFGYSYRIPYLNKAQTLGIGISTVYQQRSELVYATENNKRVFFSGDGSIREELLNKVSLRYKKALYTTQTLEIRHNYVSADDSLTALSADYLQTGSSKMNYFSLTYSITQDKRDLVAYPLTGHYIQALLVQNGLKLIDRAGPSLFYGILHAKKYWKFNDRFYGAASVTAKLSTPTHAPYYLQEGLGYSHSVRGYEYYVIDGQHFGLLRSNLKMRLLGPKVITLNFIPSEKFNTFHYAFYLNLFGDLGYVDDTLFPENNQLANDWLFGTGVGLDFVTYYDKVIRMEYSFNRLQEHGFFLHFTKSI